MDKRSLIAIVLCIIVFLVWTEFFLPKAKQQKKRTAPAAGTAKTPSPKPQTPSPKPQDPSLKPPKPPSTIDREILLTVRIALGGANILSSFDAAAAMLALQALGKTKTSAETLQEYKPESGELAFNRITAEWSSLAAAVTKITYVEKKEDGKFRFENDAHDGPYVLTEAFSSLEYSLTLSVFVEGNASDLERAHWKLVEKKGDYLKFYRIATGGVEVFKELRFHPDSYHVDVTLTFKNNPDLTGSAEKNVYYKFRGIGGITQEAFDKLVRGVYMEKSLEMRSVMPDEIRQKRSGGCMPCMPGGGGGSPGGRGRDDGKKAPMLWAGVDNRYFCGFLQPLEPGPGVINETYIEMIHKDDRKDFLLDKEKTNITSVFRSKPFKVVSSEPAVTHTYRFFVGPKTTDVLEQYEDAKFHVLVQNDMEKPSCCGVGFIFRILAQFFLLILNLIYSVIPNYGVGIIILTILIRLILHPVSKRQQISMKKYSDRMQKMQPELKHLQSRHKNNKKKLYEEQRKLMQEHGGSMIPLGGCLPMFLQLPVFLGLYRALDLAIEMRHAHFFLWITDLSKPDAAVTFSPALPILGITALNILPLLMVIAMFIQQKITPTASTGSAEQQKQQKMMMYFMLIFFAFIFYNMPAGLTLYWFTSTLLGIFESRMIKKQMAAAEAT
jgi:YidC/Oxa1 family membrane protein insertase